MTKKFYVKPATGIDNMEGDNLMTTSMQISDKTTGNSGITGGEAKMQTIDVWDNGYSEE